MRIVIILIILSLAITVSAQQLSLYEVSPADWASLSEMEKEIFVAQSCKEIMETGKEKFAIIPDVKMIVRALDAGVKEVKKENPKITMFKLLYHSLKDTGYFVQH